MGGTQQPVRDLSDYNAGSFDRGAPRWKEALWWLVRGLFFLPRWPWPSALRAVLLRMFGAKVGEGVIIRGGVNITFPWRVSIGDHVWIGEEVLILSLAPVIIGESVCISQRAFLCTGSHDHRSLNFTLVTRPITLDAGAWVAAQAFVGPGVTVGSGSIVAAGAVAMRDVPPASLVRPAPVVIEPLER